MNRRAAIQRITMILGGALSAQLTAGLMGQVINLGPSVAVSEEQQKLLAEVADTIIPTTDTPGAKAAGAEQFIVRVLRDCYVREDQEKFYAGLAKLEEESHHLHNQGFAALDAAQRHAVVKQTAASNKGFFLLLKHLTVAGYFCSEIGATKALEYLPIPGRFEGDLPLQAGQKAWAL
ncbi:MAG: gluconate 2-dehydrogenase subunit 3 family protein [Chthoniobacter sp.]|nr:gluconate 2-dehydrogenase subunit 3 family protein [Chthoniobacter sp.]